MHDELNTINEKNKEEQLIYNFGKKFKKSNNVDGIPPFENENENYK